jgi:hypothetical protein
MKNIQKSGVVIIANSVEKNLAKEKMIYMKGIVLWTIIVGYVVNAIKTSKKCFSGRLKMRKTKFYRV